MVIVEHSAETLAPMHGLRWREDRAGSNDEIIHACSDRFHFRCADEDPERIVLGWDPPWSSSCLGEMNLAAPTRQIT